MIALLLSRWRLIIGVAVITGVFFAGWYIKGKIEDSKTLAAIERTEEKHIADMQEAAELIGKEAETQIEVRYVYKQIIKEIATVSDGTCSDDPDFLRLWREANYKATATEANRSDGGV